LADDAKETFYNKSGLGMCPQLKGAKVYFKTMLVMLHLDSPWKDTYMLGMKDVFEGGGVSDPEFFYQSPYIPYLCKKYREGCLHKH
jgi:hypothetical protein